MPRRLIDRLRGLVGSPPRRPPSKFRGAALKAKTSSPLPISVALDDWEEMPEPKIDEPEQQELEPPFGEVTPGSVDLRKYLGPNWKG